MPESNLIALPPERVAEMPEQSLRVFDPPDAVQDRLRRMRPEPAGVQAARFLFALGVFGTVGFGVWLLADRLSWNGITVFEAVLVLVYAVLLLWLAGNFWLCVAGAFAMAKRRLAGPESSSGPLVQSAPARTAVLIPLYNENPRDVFARISAMIRSVDEAGGAGVFDFFVLSDSTDPRRYLEEEWRWFDTCRQLGVHDSLFYRRRDTNAGRKAGNIAEFCRRWGNGYDYMVVLDADSLMSGDALLECVGRMNANPSLGLLQTWPRPIGGTTVFARAQQFAAAVAGPLMVHGMAALGGRAGNYWGHNAIIRCHAFIESCGLPRLQGRPPLGGEILSHDFVEAALLVRNGWAVRLDPNIAGSYEQAPPNLVESLRRDRRWCQGNLQHLRVLLARGLHPVSRINLLVGILSFLVAPVWLVFVAVGIAVALGGGVSERVADVSAQTRVGPDSTGAGQFSPLTLDADVLTLIGLTAILLLGPKLMGLFAALFAKARKRAQGGTLRTTGGCLLETALFALIAPAVMLAHSRFVVEVLLGRSVAWMAPERDAAHVTWAEATRPLRWVLLAAIIVAALGTLLATAASLWLTPILLSAVLAIPFAVLTGRRDVDLALRRLGLLSIPEEKHPAQVQRDYAKRLRASEAENRETRDPISVLRSLAWLQLHMGLTPLSPITVDAEQIDEARRFAMAHGLQDLSLEDCRVLLAWSEALDELAPKTQARES